MGFNIFQRLALTVWSFRADFCSAPRGPGGSPLGIAAGIFYARMSAAPRAAWRIAPVGSLRGLHTEDRPLRGSLPMAF